jgi:hypothetical protein
MSSRPAAIGEGLTFLLQVDLQFNSLAGVATRTQPGRSRVSARWIIKKPIGQGGRLVADGFMRTVPLLR